jgi:hypothetical protein
MQNAPLSSKFTPLHSSRMRSPCSTQGRNGRVVATLLLLCIAVVVSWYPWRRSVDQHERLAATIAEVLEEEIAKAASPHSDVNDNSVLRYSNEMHLLQRMPEHLFSATSVLCRAACSRTCSGATQQTSACRCPNPFDEILNLSRTDPDRRWQTMSDLDIAKRGKTLDMCSAIQACNILARHSNDRPACAARSERIFQGELDGEAQEHADDINQRARRPEKWPESDSRLKAQLIRTGPAAVRQLFEYISSITFGEHSVGIIEQILKAALPEVTSFQGDFVDVGCGRGKMIAGD